MPVSTSNIPGLLLPGARAVRGDYKDMPTQWSRIFKQGSSNMEAERTIHMRYLALPELRSQGGATATDQNAGQRWTYNHVHIEFALGYAFTQIAIEDNLYKSSFNATNLGLARVFRQMKEIVCAGVLNTGNVLNQQIGGDNVPLFSASHPVDGYNIPNTPTQQVGLNESTMNFASNMVRRFRDDAGLLTSQQARLLVVPVDLRHVAKRLIETELRPGTNDNDVNTIKENGDYGQNYFVMDFLTSPYAWFVMSDLAEGGLIHLQRRAFDTSMQTDFTTDNLMVKATERYYAGYDNWRAAVGFFPTN